MKKEKLVILLVISIIFIIALFGFIFPSQKHTENTQVEKEIKEYIIAINNINLAYSSIGEADIYHNIANKYTQSSDYYYEEVTDMYKYAKEKILKSQETLKKSKLKLKEIEPKFKDDFLKEEIKNRIEQTDALYTFSDNLYLLIDYSEKMLYEVNYGSEEKAEEYLKIYNSLVPTYNHNLYKLSEINNKIDILWNQDWYEIAEKEIEGF